MQLETSDELVVLLSDSDSGSVYNKGSSTIENKADWCVNRYLRSNQFVGRRVEEEEETEEEDGENHGLTDFRYRSLLATL